MAYQSFTNLLINDKQFDALHLPPRAPTSSENKSNDIEGGEILFQARNVLKAHENPTLLFLGDGQVHRPTNAPKINIPELPHAIDSRFEAKMKRLMASRVYSARYRHKKLVMLHHLETQAKSLEEKVSMTRYQLHHLGSVRDKLVEENTAMEAHCSAAKMLIAEKEAENQALMEEIQRLRTTY